MKNKIRIYRAIHSMTQDELAKKIGVTRKTVNSIEGGKYNPSIDVAYRMARLFDLRIEELFCFEDGEDGDTDGKEGHSRDAKKD